MSRRNVRPQKSTHYKFVEVSEGLLGGMSQCNPEAKGVYTLIARKEKVFYLLSQPDLVRL